MSVHYRFKSALEYDTITFDGLHISVKDLKNSIIQQKRIGRSTDFDLRITNAQTQEVYTDENALIPKNTSLLIARIPVTTPKTKQWEGYGGSDTPPAKVDDIGAIGKAVDLANLDAPEDDKIKAMMTQSTQEYDPSNYVKIRGANQVGPVPLSYRCYKCHQNGHWIKDCPLGQGVENVEIKKSTGIPQSFMVPVEGPQVPGAMMMSNGQYAVPALDYQAYSQKSTAPVPAVEPKPEIPDDLLCSICSDLLTDAVMIPCCGNSFCDECIRGVLLESEEHECPDCHEKDISPATLIPNRFLRKSVATFKNTTGYEKKPTYKPRPVVNKEAEPKKDPTPPPPVVDSTEKEHQKLEEKTVISEADSTEHTKSETDFSKVNKDIDLEQPKSDDVDGPPGVSPPLRHSPKHHVTKMSDRTPSSKEHESSSKHKHRSDSPRKHRRKSPSYESRRSEERQGTPTRDEPPGIGNTYIPASSRDPFSSNIPPGTLPPGNLIGPLQGPPPSTMPPGTFPPPGAHLGGFPPVQRPPPNFRIPPPGTQPPPFMGSGPYPRPLFDPSRPPMGGLGNFGSSYGGRSREYSSRRGMRDRTPPGIIDDPLAAFNRILREKDEKRARQRLARRSWSRSRSRSRSYSRSPPPLRRRSRTPRRRSRSRSFSMSRRRTDRDRSEFDREYDRSSFRDKSRARRANSRDRFYDERDREYDRALRGLGGAPPNQQQQQWGAQRNSYYPPAGDPQSQQPTYPTRYPQRDYHPHMPNMPLQRPKFDDIAPPGIEQPPVPGLESESLPLDFNRDRKSPEHREKERDKYTSHRDDDKDRKDRSRRRDDKRSRSRSASPEKWRNPSPKSKDATPDKAKRRRISSDSREDKRRGDKYRDYSDDDKRRSKDKKKHKERKDEKKKKKDKKEKHHKRTDKDKKDKRDEFKQVIPRGDADNDAPERAKKSDEKPRRKDDTTRRKSEDDKERNEDEERQREQRKQAEEKKKEERRLRFIEDEKKKREEDARKEEHKKKAIEEARRILEEDQRRTEQKPNKADLYDNVIPEKDAHTEINENFGNPKPELQNPAHEKHVGEEADAHSHKETEEEDSGILELHSDMDIKLEENDILAQVPEKSKWEVDEEGQIQTSPELKELDDSKPAKVSNEVLKRAENVIFARAINSIRPIEIKKISGERAKLYADEKKDTTDDTKISEALVEKPRLSVKDRLGVKVNDPDPRIILIENRRSRSASPYPRKERRIELQDYRRRDRRTRSKSKKREYSRDSEKRRDRPDRKRAKRDDKDKSKNDDKKERKRRSHSPSDSEESRKKRKERKTKKEKDRPKKTEKEDDKDKETAEQKLKTATEKRKPTLDEASFEPDYDLELQDEDAGSDTEKVSAKKEKDSKRSEPDDEDSSTSDSSTSSSEEEKKKKKRKKHRKKKRKDSSTSSSDSSAECTDSEKERKRKKHKKNKKKKKKSKHK